MWKRLNYRMRYQVYLRVLPVLFLAVLALGIFSWAVFTRWTLNSALEYQNKDLSTFIVQLQNRAAVAAMSAEAHRSALILRTKSEECLVYGPQILQVPLVRGICVVGPAGQEKPGDSSFHLVDFLVTETNKTIMAQWWQSRLNFFEADFKEGTWSKSRGSQASIALNNDLFHSTRVFPPLLLQDKSSGSTGKQKAFLPVMVRENIGVPGISLPNRKKWNKGAVYLLDLNALSSEIPTSSWYAIMNEAGQVLVSSSIEMEAGCYLKDQPGDANRGLLSIARGSDLESLLTSAPGQGHGIFGSLFSPWLVISKTSDEMPIRFMSARPVGYLQQMTLRYFAMVLGIAILALSGAVAVVTRVMKPFSKRLSDLAKNMEDVAKGNYSQRMPGSINDEMGQLVGYFNLMAVSLDEAHRQVKEKAVHLRAALENMRMLDRAKDDFLILISHEVRTPLTAIMGGVNFLKSSVDKVEGPDREILDKLNVGEITDIIEKSSNRLSGFMTDAIQMTAIQSSNQILDLKPVPVVDLIEMGLCGVRDQAREKGVTIENNLDEKVPWSVLCDIGIMKVAFERLLDNSIKHNHIGGVIRIAEVRAIPGHGEVHDVTEIDRIRSLMGQASMQEWEDEELRWRIIEIFNSGEPIPEDRIGALFGKFEIVGRIENHQKGSGLSLPIAQAAVVHHGGGIFVNSNGKTGNSFFVLLPTIIEQQDNRIESGSGLWDDALQGVSSVAGDKKVGKVTDPAGLKVEFDNRCPAGSGQGDESGSGVYCPGSADNDEKITIVSS